MLHQLSSWQSGRYFISQQFMIRPYSKVVSHPEQGTSRVGFISLTKILCGTFTFNYIIAVTSVIFSYSGLNK